LGLYLFEFEFGRYGFCAIWICVSSSSSSDAARVVSFRKMPPMHDLALCKQKTLRLWGLMAQRGWARLILGRFHDLVPSPGDPTAATREPDSVSHEHNTFFFPDTVRHR
jgi:hypothetical protein